MAATPLRMQAAGRLDGKGVLRRSSGEAGGGPEGWEPWWQIRSPHAPFRLFLTS